MLDKIGNYFTCCLLSFLLVVAFAGGASIYQKIYLFIFFWLCSALAGIALFSFLGFIAKIFELIGLLFSLNNLRLCMNKLINTGAKVKEISLSQSIFITSIITALIALFLFRYELKTTKDNQYAYKLDRWTGDVYAVDGPEETLIIRK